MAKKELTDTKIYEKLKKMSGDAITQFENIEQYARNYVLGNISDEKYGNVMHNFNNTSSSRSDSLKEYRETLKKLQKEGKNVGAALKILKKVENESLQFSEKFELYSTSTKEEIRERIEKSVRNKYNIPEESITDLRDLPSFSDLSSAYGITKEDYEVLSSYSFRIKDNESFKEKLDATSEKKKDEVTNSDIDLNDYEEEDLDEEEYIEEDEIIVPNHENEQEELEEGFYTVSSPKIKSASFNNIEMEEVNDDLHVVKAPKIKTASYNNIEIEEVNDDLHVVKAPNIKSGLLNNIKDEKDKRKNEQEENRINEIDEELNEISNNLNNSNGHISLKDMNDLKTAIKLINRFDYDLANSSFNTTNELFEIDPKTGMARIISGEIIDGEFSDIEQLSNQKNKYDDLKQKHEFLLATMSNYENEIKNGTQIPDKFMQKFEEFVKKPFELNMEKDELLYEKEQEEKKIDELEKMDKLVEEKLSDFQKELANEVKEHYDINGRESDESTGEYKGAEDPEQKDPNR